MGGGPSKVGPAAPGQTYTPARQVLVRPNDGNPLAMPLLGGSTTAKGGESVPPDVAADLYSKLDELTAKVHRLEREFKLSRRENGWPDGKIGRAQTLKSLEDKPRLCSASPPERAAFLQEKWLPFIAELKHAMRATRSRSVGGFSPEEILPPQKQINEWSERNLALTAAWHGRPNLSVMYEFIIEVSTLDPSSPYKFAAVPSKRSADGWIRVIDGAVRGSFYKPSNDNEHEQVGGMKQTVGESAIANTALPNLMSAAESRLLLAGGAMKGFLVNKLAKRQKALLHELGAALRAHPRSAETGLTQFAAALQSFGEAAKSREEHDKRLDPSQLKGMLERAENAATATAAEGGEAGDVVLGEVMRGQAGAGKGIDLNGVAWQVLRDRGMIIASYGQLSTEQKTAIHSYLKDELKTDDDDAQGQGTAEQIELEAFIKFCHDKPGSIYKDDPTLHKRMMLSIALSKKYKVVSKAEVEKHTVHRFLPTEWVRQCPLLTLGEDGPNEVRPANVEENSRFRPNKFPYAEAHGIGLSGGGLEMGMDALSGKSDAELKRIACMPTLFCLLALAPSTTTPPKTTATTAVESIAPYNTYLPSASSMARGSRVEWTLLARVGLPAAGTAACCYTQQSR